MKKEDAQSIHDAIEQVLNAENTQLQKSRALAALYANLSEDGRFCFVSAAIVSLLIRQDAIEYLSGELAEHIGEWPCLTASW